MDFLSKRNKFIKEYILLIIMEDKIKDYKVRAFDLGIMLERVNTERNAVIQEIARIQNQQEKPVVKKPTTEEPKESKK